MLHIRTGRLRDRMLTAVYFAQVVLVLARDSVITAAVNAVDVAATESQID